MIYPFKTDPYLHQLAGWERSRDETFFALLMQYGSGKSWVLLNTAGWLYKQGKIGVMLIVSPKGVYRNFTSPEGEIAKHLPDHVERVVGWYDATGGKESRDSVIQVIRPSTKLRILAINVESLATDRGKDLCVDFLDSAPSLMCIDESTSIKNTKALRTKAAVAMGRHAKYTRILTGDAMANSPLDVYGQFEFLCPGSLGFTSFIAFRNRFARLAPVPGAPRWVKRVVGFRDLETLRELVGRKSFFADKPPLPPKVYMPPRQCGMLPEQKRAYDEMRRYSLVEIGRQLEMFQPEATVEELLAASHCGCGPDYLDPDCQQHATSAKGNNTAKVKMASAEIVLTQTLRLMQIACGFVKTETGEEVDLCDGANPRVAELLSVIEEMGPTARVIVWATFKRSIQEIREALAKEYGKDSVVVYDGSTSSDDREKAKQLFQDPKSPVRFFIGNQQTAGRGITLTEATGVVYYSNNFDNEIRANSEDRCHRLGLTHSVVYVDLVSAPVDLKVGAAILAKKTLSDMLQDGSWKEIFS